MIRLVRAAVVALAVAAFGSGCEDDFAGEPPVDELTVLPPQVAAVDPIVPLPTALPDLDARKVALGERLFRDPIVSPRGDVACTTCHELARGGVDGRAKSSLPGQDAPAFHTPTVFNVVFNFKCHWEGAYDALTEQLAVPVQSPRVLNTTFDDIVARVRKSVEYRDAFDAIYPHGLDVASLKDALVEFERSLVTPNARFDRFLMGETDAITADELHGYELFKSYGCISCHQGINVGGNMYQRLGVMRDYFGEKGTLKDADFGRYNVTKKEEDRHFFRVPSLRNVAVTAPYLHDGSAKTLEEVVEIMGRYQLGRQLDDHDVKLIVAFLRTLTGEYKGRRLE
ncbi:MAG TPA: cytochrome c peroxidase [Polyangiaceae bacterium]|nr:cytochrome c peroxidase [Polyangiaceae bacterium]